MSATITQQRLKCVLQYSPDAGVFVWNVNKSKNVIPGAIAGCLNRVGYWVIRIDGVLHLAHRLAWLYMTGEQPDRVDHANMIRTDNRWVNLRNGSGSFNMQNRREANKNNKCGLLGVTTARNGKYTARIMIDGKTIGLGTFADQHHAHAEYLKAKREIHPGCTI